MGVLASMAGVLGLLGVVVGAVLTAAAQERAARRARKAAIDAAARDAVRELLATSDILAGLYEGVWQLDGLEGRPQPEAAYDRAVAAWADYQHARARVRLAAPHEVFQATGELTAALRVEVEAVDSYYQRAEGAKPLTQKQVDDVAERRAAAQVDILARLDESVPLPAWPGPGDAPHSPGARRGAGGAR